MAQEYAEKASQKAVETTTDEEPTGLSPDSQDRVDKLSDEVDDLLADIDELLEPNAQEFVDSFRQKGGQ